MPDWIFRFVALVTVFCLVSTEAQAQAQAQAQRRQRQAQATQARNGSVGESQNRAFIGVGRQLTAWAKRSFGYELDMLRSVDGSSRNEHNIKLNLAFSLN